MSGIYSFAFGGSLMVEYLGSPDFSLTLKAGLLEYITTNKFVNGEFVNLRGLNSFIPILAGFKYHFTPKVYRSDQLGITLSIDSPGGSAFTYAPGIGFQVSYT